MGASRPGRTHSSSRRSTHADSPRHRRRRGAVLRRGAARSRGPRRRTGQRGADRRAPAAHRELREPRPAVPLGRADRGGHRQQRLPGSEGAPRPRQGLPRPRRRQDDPRGARRPEPRRSGPHPGRAAHHRQQGALAERRGHQRKHLDHPAAGGELRHPDDLPRLRLAHPDREGLQVVLSHRTQRRHDGGERVPVPQGVAGSRRPQGPQDHRPVHLRQSLLPGQPEDRPRPLREGRLQDRGRSHHQDRRHHPGLRGAAPAVRQPGRPLLGAVPGRDHDLPGRHEARQLHAQGARHQQRGLLGPDVAERAEGHQRGGGVART